MNKTLLICTNTRSPQATPKTPARSHARSTVTMLPTSPPKMPGRRSKKQSLTVTLMMPETPSRSTSRLLTVLPLTRKFRWGSSMLESTCGLSRSNGNSLELLPTWISKAMLARSTLYRTGSQRNLPVLVKEKVGPRRGMRSLLALMMLAREWTA